MSNTADALREVLERVHRTMTRKRFWDDPYCTEITTHITSLTATDVTVADTIFYAFSGGQESDRGTIDDIPVLAAQKHDLDIVYTLETIDGLVVGKPVRMCIDWERRYALMRLHFAAEIVLELVRRRFAGIEKLGAHIAQDKARIDFRLSESIAPYLPNLRADAQAIIASDAIITSAFSDEAQQRRYWQIDGFARVSCGGTHPRRTGEVGTIALRRKNVGKDKERIEITLS
jgi:Ser-tRNA(Ala) deacylase AlaX